MKFSQYNYVLNCKNGIAILNTYISNYVKLTNDEDINHIHKLISGELELDIEDKMVKALYEKGFIVDSNIDEYNRAKQEMDAYFKVLEKRFKITLYVTDQCNFRCVYCPENHVNNIFSDKNWNALFKHIEKNVKSGKYTSVSISFFGGEPLLEVNKIIQFLEKLKELSIQYPNVEFNNNITTNGYLLTPELYDKLVSLNLLKYQITVDGFAEIHDKTRVLVGGQGTWNKIIENLKYINSKNDNANILLRANYNASNVNTLKDYNKWQKKTFDNPKFEFHYFKITEFSELVPKELVADYNADEVLDIESTLNDCARILKKMNSVCNTAYPSSYAITSKGGISKCENLTGNHFESCIIGQLDENGDFVFKNGTENWFTNFETEECKTCIAYPICYARSCPRKKVNYPETRPDCATITKNFQIDISNIFKHF